MRITPHKKYRGQPCSYVSTGCAYESITSKKFDAPLPEGLRETGWATLDILNRYVRQHLPIKRKIYYRRSERFKLRNFLEQNKERAVVCVYGHAIYVDGENYWSFFKNLDDDIVCIWYIK